MSITKITNFRLIASVCALAFCLPATAEEEGKAYYAGKTVRMIVGSGPGGGYDTLIRLYSRHVARHLPGKPNIIVMNQPGAGGLTAFNHAGKVAPQDGTFITLVGQGLMVHEPTGQPGMQLSLAAFKWLGNFSQAPNVTAVWSSSKARTLEDARRMEVVLGSTGAGSPDAQIPTVYNAFLGTKFKVVFGYEGGGALNLAMERGEIEGRGTNTWGSYKATLPAAVALNGISYNIARSFGPAIGGILVAVGSPGSALGIDAVSFAVCALLLSRIRITRRADAAPRESYFHELRAGWREFTAHTWL